MYQDQVEISTSHAQGRCEGHLLSSLFSYGYVFMGNVTMA